MAATNFKVVVVENDPAILKAVGRLLRAYQYEFELYESAEAFLERQGTADIGCLLLDIHLGGMSGIELQSKLVTERRAPPIVFLTSQTDEAMIEQAINDGCVAYLYKPFEAQALLQALQAARAKV